MKRLAYATVALLLLTAPTAHAGQERFTGNWLIRFFDDGEVLSFWMVKIDAKMNGTLEVAANFPECKLQDLKAGGDTLSFAIHFQGQLLEFVCQVPKGPFKTLYGTFRYQGEVYPVQLQATKMESLKEHKPVTKLIYPKGDFNELKAKVAKDQDELGVFEVAEVLIGQADKDKATAAALKEALAPALIAAKRHGDSWYQEVALVMARKMAAHKAYAAMGEELIQEILKALEATAAGKQLRVLDVLATSLRKQGKKEELAKVRLRLDALEPLGHEENEKAGLGFEPQKLKERKGNRVLLVELFTGASCRPCVAADLAFEGLGKSYARSEVVLLQYHLHIPSADPLATPDTEARAHYYGEALKGTPTVFLNGKPGPSGGGSRGAAGELYKEYRSSIDPVLAGTTKVKLSASALRGGDKVTIQASVGDVLPAPGDKLRLRFVVVEKWVRYPGPNGLSYHAHVVRAMPGGPKGIAVTKAAQEEKLTIDLNEVRQTASKQLDQYAALEGQRPFSFRELTVVVFLQDDGTQEVLHAIEVAVK